MAEQRPLTVVINGKFTAAIISLFFVTLIGFNAWLGSSVIDIHGSVADIEEKIAVIEGNRFTSLDAYNLVKEIEKGIPPNWFLQRVEKLESRISELEKHAR